MFEGEPIGLPAEEEVFESLIEQSKWAELAEFIKARTRLRRAYEQGGFVINHPNKNRARQLIKNEMLKHPESAESIKIGLFMGWYENQTGFREDLDRYFLSDEYKEMVDSKGLNEHYYHLPDEKFEGLSGTWSSDEARFLLLFSPVLFTVGQAEKLAKIDRAPRNAPKEKPAPKHESIQALNREREAEKENRQLKRDLERERAECRRLQAEASRSLNEISSLRTKITELEERKAKIEGDKRDLDATVRSIRAEAVALEKKNKELAAELGKNIDTVAVLYRSMDELRRKNGEVTEESPIDRVLLDHGKRELLFTEIRRAVDGVQAFEKLLEEQGESPVERLGLASFWRKLCDKENEIIGRVSRITRSEITKAEFVEEWSVIEDDFEDIEYLGQAKVALIAAINQLLREVASDLDREGG